MHDDDRVDCDRPRGNGGLGEKPGQVVDLLKAVLGFDQGPPTCFSVFFTSSQSIIYVPRSQSYV